MIHNTYRRLDEPALQLGPLSIGQWAVVVVLGALCYVLRQVTGMGTQAILCIATVVVGGPFWLMALSEGNRPSYTRVIRDALLWTVRPKLYAAGGGTPRPFTLKVEAPRTKRGELPAVADTKELTA